jgi:hypothetical protein
MQAVAGVRRRERGTARLVEHLSAFERLMHEPDLGGFLRLETRLGRHTASRALMVARDGRSR